MTDTSIFMDPQYLQRYKSFLEEYDKVVSRMASGTETPTTVSRFICELAQYFCELNTALALATKGYNRKRESIAKTQDDNGKALAVDKIKFIAEATDEYMEMVINRTHVENIEKLVFALYALRKGGETEAKMGGSWNG